MKIRLLCMGLVALTVIACKPKSDDPAVPGDPASKPQWQAVINPEFPSSMTITCLPPSGETVTADDEVAAFWGDTCRAVAGQANGIFYMVINGPQTTVAMQVKYYSATYKTIRTAQITYTPEANIGSTDSPYRLDFSGAVATPKRITLTGVMPGSDAVQGRKIHIGEEDKDGNLNLFWQEGDQIKLKGYNGSDSTILTLSSGKNTRYGKFTDWTTTDWGINTHVTYPATASYNADNEVVSYTFPEKQDYVAGNFAQNLMPGYSLVTENKQGTAYQFNLRPIASLVQLQLTSKNNVNVQSIKIEVPKMSSNQVHIAGTMSIDVRGTTAATTGGNSQAVTLDCGGIIVNNESTAFNIVLPSVTLPKGTKFAIIDNKKDTFVNTTSADFTLGPGQYYPISMQL